MIEGRTITEVRRMTKAELDEQGWDDPWGRSVVLVLDDGTRLFPSIDDEGNGPGTLFGADAEGDFRLNITEVG